ncbi:MAG: RNase adapter RapZ [Acidobacteria bacterium]|nr:RNase adapter RapZ [Acidobacteriota bacterium]
MPKSPPRQSKRRKSSRISVRARRNGAASEKQVRPGAPRPFETDLVIVTGMSGSGKASVLKAFEDLGFYCVDNLPVDLIPKFAELTRNSPDIVRAALVVDIREGEALERFPAIYRELRQKIPALLIFLHARDAVLLRRFSETRRPHPLGGHVPLRQGIARERKLLATIHNLADLVVDTSHLNVHELRSFISDHFRKSASQRSMLISCISFGYRYGIPPDSDLVFDVRFLPNPNYIPQFHNLSGKDPKVARYIRSFPQTREFNQHISELLAYLIPHYVREGKSYLTLAFGCTGGRHRSVMIAETIAKNLRKKGFRIKTVHRDVAK